MDLSAFQARVLKDIAEHGPSSRNHVSNRMKRPYKNIFHAFSQFAEQGLIEDYGKDPGFSKGDFWLTEEGLVTALALGADPSRIRSAMPPEQHDSSADRDWVMFLLDWAVLMPRGRFAFYAEAFLKAGSGEKYLLIPQSEDTDSMTTALRKHPVISDSFKKVFNDFLQQLG